MPLFPSFLLISHTRAHTSCPQTEGVGTIRSNIGPAFAEFEDDGGLSSASSESENEDGDSEEEDEEDECDSDDEEREREREEGVYSLLFSESSQLILRLVVVEGAEPGEGVVPASVSRLQGLYQPPEISIIPGSPATEADAALGGRTPTGPSPLTTP
ncbi:hypothetical protein DFH06DRAFT_1033135, partial [Mycena polygramma]